MIAWVFHFKVAFSNKFLMWKFFKENAFMKKEVEKNVK
jgi:hypothetical protein